MAAHQNRKPKQPPRHETPPSQARIIALITFLIAVLTAATCAVMVWAEPRPIGDLFVAFASGRDTLAGKIAKPDEWAFTTTGRVWFNQNYGTHLLHYLGYLWWGEWGVLGMKLFFVVAATAFIALAGRQRGASWAVALIAAGGAIAATRSYTDMRPNLTTLTFAPLVLWMFYLSRKCVHLIWVTVVVTTLWANAHNGFIFGVCMIMLWAGVRSLTLLASTRSFSAALRKAWPLLAAAALAILLANFANPFTVANLSSSAADRWSLPKLFEYILFPFSILAPAWKKLNEWQPMFPEHPTGFGTIWEFFVVTGILAWLTVLRAMHYVFSEKWSREDFSFEKAGMFLFDAALTGTLVVMSYQARRFIPLAVILLGPLLAIQLQWLARRPSLSWLLLACLPPAVGAGVTGLTADYHALEILALILAPLAAGAVLGGLANLASGPSAAGTVLRAVLLPLTASALLAPVGYYAWRQYVFYRPDNPLFSHESTFERMNGVIYMPTGAARFIRDNDISGRVLNEWRWEGYLRWMCPKVKVFLGGRAHQVYAEETDAQVTTIMWYPANAHQLLSEQDVHLVVIPAEEKYTQLIMSLLSNQWAQLYFDGRDTVVADGQYPPTLDLIRRCAEGKLMFPNEFAATVSRAVCMTAPVLKYPPDAFLQVFVQANRLMPSLVNYRAIWQLTPRSPDRLQWIKAYFEQEAARLWAMDVNKANGFQLLQCRRTVADYLAQISRDVMNVPEAARWQREGRQVQAQMAGMRREWDLRQ